jgi:hypothetical protein
MKTQKLTATESERMAYMAGDTATAELYGRIDTLHYALGESVAALQSISTDVGTIKHARMVTNKTLTIIGQNFDLFDVEDSAR